MIDPGGLCAKVVSGFQPSDFGPLYLGLSAPASKLAGDPVRPRLATWLTPRPFKSETCSESP